MVHRYLVYATAPEKSLWPIAQQSAWLFDFFASLNKKNRTRMNLSTQKIDVLFSPRPAPQFVWPRFYPENFVRHSFRLVNNHSELVLK